MLSFVTFNNTGNKNTLKTMLISAKNLHIFLIISPTLAVMYNDQVDTNIERAMASAKSKIKLKRMLLNENLLFSSILSTIPTIE
jgi:ABC-type dipeptide/oligopeptide/nickel transport system ATPase subunit